MKATRLLEAQHEKAVSLINRILRRRAGRDKLVAELADVLAAHMLIEEEIFYPVARGVQSKVVDQAIEEHDLTLIELQRVLATPSDARELEVRLEALRTLLQHHVAIEENAMFPTMEQLLTKGQNAALGQQLKVRFKQVLPKGSQQILSMRKTSVTCPAPGAISRGRRGWQRPM